MIDVNNLSMSTSVSNNKNLFESVAKSYDNAKDVYRVQYSILNYGMILDTMIKFVDGYKRYAESGNEKYDGKVLSISRNFYDTMFTDKKKYRKVIELKQFKDIMTDYLKKTKELQSIIMDELKDPDSAEMDSFIRMTDNQYKKIAKVFRDDMKIFLYLNNSDSKFFAYKLDDQTRKAFNDKRTPVMHKYKKGDF